MPLANFNSVLVIEETNTNNCTGMIIDADHAIQLIRVSPYLTSTHRSVCGRTSTAQTGVKSMGTVHFMPVSQRLLGLWMNGQGAVHTALDDLESFLWVLIWAVFSLMRKNKHLGASGKYVHVWDGFRAPVESLEKTYGSKNVVTVMWKMRIEEESREWILWQPLVQIFLNICAESRGALSNALAGPPVCTSDALKVLTRIYFQRFAESLLEILEGEALPKSW